MMALKHTENTLWLAVNVVFLILDCTAQNNDKQSTIPDTLWFQFTEYIGTTKEEKPWSSLPNNMDSKIDNFPIAIRYEDIVISGNDVEPITAYNDTILKTLLWFQFMQQQIGTTKRVSNEKRLSSLPDDMDSKIDSFPIAIRYGDIVIFDNDVEPSTAYKDKQNTILKTLLWFQFTKQQQIGITKVSNEKRLLSSLPDDMDSKIDNFPIANRYEDIVISNNDVEHITTYNSDSSENRVAIAADDWQVDEKNNQQPFTPVPPNITEVVIELDHIIVTWDTPSYHISILNYIVTLFSDSGSKVITVNDTVANIDEMKLAPFNTYIVSVQAVTHAGLSLPGIYHFTTNKSESTNNDIVAEELKQGVNVEDESFLVTKSSNSTDDNTETRDTSYCIKVLKIAKYIIALVGSGIKHLRSAFYHPEIDFITKHLKGDKVSAFNSVPLYITEVIAGDDFVIVKWNTFSYYVPIVNYAVTLLSDDGNKVITVTDTVANISDLTLAPFSTYIVSVQAITHAGPSLPGIYHFTTQESAPSAAPINVTSYAVTSKELFICWSPPPLNKLNGIIRHYAIRYKKTIDQSTVLLAEIKQVSGNTLNTTLHNLSPGTTYEISVYATTVANGPSATLQQTTISAPLNVSDQVPVLVSTGSSPNSSFSIVLPHYSGDTAIVLWVVVIKISSSFDISQSPDSLYPNNDSFILASGFDTILDDSPYIAAEILTTTNSTINFMNVFEVGNEEATSPINNDHTYSNPPLASSSSYTAFIRVFPPAVPSNSSFSYKDQSVIGHIDRQYRVFESTQFIPIVVTPSTSNNNGMSGLELVKLILKLALVVCALACIGTLGKCAFEVIINRLRPMDDQNSPPDPIEDPDADHRNGLSFIPPSLAEKTPEEKEVFDLLRSKARYWDNIGRELGIDMNYRQTLEMNRDAEKNLEIVIYKWREKQGNPTWNDLMAALRNLEYNDVINKFKKQVSNHKLKLPDDDVTNEHY